MTKLKNQIPLAGKKVWRIYGVFETLVVLIVCATLGVLTFIFDWPQWLYALFGGVILVAAYLFVVVFPNILHRTWSYEVRDSEIEVQSGLFVVKRTIVPMVRVQHVDTEQGPILKRNNLANISISSAATTHTIPFLVSEEADALRARISELAKVAKDDV